MWLRGLSIDEFLERIADMPDVEALQEIDLRCLRIDEERAGGATNEEREVLNTDDRRLRNERHLIVSRMDKRKWSKAVRAIFGQDGLEQCLEWMELAGEPAPDQAPLRKKT